MLKVKIVVHVDSKFQKMNYRNKNDMFWYSNACLDPFLKTEHCESDTLMEMHW